MEPHVHTLRYEINESNACFFVDQTPEKQQQQQQQCFHSQGEDLEPVSTTQQKQFLWQSQKWIVTMFDESQIPTIKKKIEVVGSKVHPSSKRRRVVRRFAKDGDTQEYIVTEYLYKNYKKTNTDTSDTHTDSISIGRLREFVWKPKNISTEESFLLVTLDDDHNVMEQLVSNESDLTKSFTNSYCASFSGYDDFEMTYDEDQEVLLESQQLAEKPDGGLAQMTFLTEKLLFLSATDDGLTTMKEAYEVKPINMTLQFHEPLVWMEPYTGNYGQETSHFQISERFGDSIGSSLLQIRKRGLGFSDFSFSLSDVRRMRYYRKQENIEKKTYADLPEDVVVVDSVKPANKQDDSDDEEFEDLSIDLEQLNDGKPKPKGDSKVTATTKSIDIVKPPTTLLSMKDDTVCNESDDDEIKQVSFSNARSKEPSNSDKENLSEQREEVVNNSDECDANHPSAKTSAGGVKVALKANNNKGHFVVDNTKNNPSQGQELYIVEERSVTLKAKEKADDGEESKNEKEHFDKEDDHLSQDGDRYSDICDSGYEENTSPDDRKINNANSDNEDSLKLREAFNFDPTSAVEFIKETLDEEDIMSPILTSKSFSKNKPSKQSAAEDQSSLAVFNVNPVICEQYSELDEPLNRTAKKPLLTSRTKLSVEDEIDITPRAVNYGKEEVDITSAFDKLVKEEDELLLKDFVSSRDREKKQATAISSPVTEEILQKPKHDRTVALKKSDESADSTSSNIMVQQIQTQKIEISATLKPSESRVSTNLPRKLLTVVDDEEINVQLRSDEPLKIDFDNALIHNDLEEFKSNHSRNDSFTQQTLDDEEVLKKPQAKGEKTLPKRDFKGTDASPSIVVQQIQTKKIEISTTSTSLEARVAKRSVLKDSVPIVDDEEINCQVRSDKLLKIDFGNAINDNDLEDFKSDVFKKDSFTQQTLGDEKVLAKSKVKNSNISSRKDFNDINTAPYITVHHVQAEQIEVSSTLIPEKSRDIPNNRDLFPKDSMSIVHDEEINVQLRSDEPLKIDFDNALIDNDLEEFKSDRSKNDSFTQQTLDDEKVLPKPQVKSDKTFSKRDFKGTDASPSIVVQQIQTQKIEISSTSTSLEARVAKRNVLKDVMSIVDDEDVNCQLQSDEPLMIDFDNAFINTDLEDLKGDRFKKDSFIRLTLDKEDILDAATDPHFPDGRQRFNTENTSTDDEHVAFEIKPVTAQTINISRGEKSQRINEVGDRTKGFSIKSTVTEDTIKDERTEGKVDFDLHKHLGPIVTTSTGYSKRHEFHIIYKYKDLIDDKTLNSSSTSLSPTNIVNETASSPSYRRKTFSDGEEKPGNPDEELHSRTNKSSSVSLRVKRNQHSHVSFADQQSSSGNLLDSSNDPTTTTTSPGKVTVAAKGGSDHHNNESYIDLDGCGEESEATLDDDVVGGNNEDKKEKRKSIKSKAKRFVLKKLASTNKHNKHHTNNIDPSSSSSAETTSTGSAETAPTKERRTSSSSIKRFGSSIKSRISSHHHHQKKTTVAEEEEERETISSPPSSPNFTLSPTSPTKRGLIGIQRLKYDDDGYEPVRERSKRYNQTIDDVDDRLSSTMIMRPTMVRSRSYDSMLDAKHQTDKNEQERRRRLAGYSYVSRTDIPDVVVKGRDYSTTEAIYRETETELAYIRRQRRKKLFPEYSQSLEMLDQEETEKRRAKEVKTKQELEKMRKERHHQKKKIPKKQQRNRNSMDLSLDALNKIKDIGRVRIPDVFKGSRSSSSHQKQNQHQQQQLEVDNSSHHIHGGGSPVPVGKLRIPRAFSDNNLLDIDDDGNVGGDVSNKDNDVVYLKVTNEFDI